MNFKTISVLLIILSWGNYSFGQNDNGKRHIIKDGNIYIDYNIDAGKIQYLSKRKGQKSPMPLKPNHQMEIKGSTVANIYLKWLNPLQYGIQFKDSIYADPEIKVINDFLELAFGRLNTVADTDNPQKQEIKTRGDTYNKSQMNKGSKFLNIKTAFKDRDLRMIQLFLHTTKFDSTEISDIIWLHNTLEVLDTLQIDHISILKNEVEKLRKIEKASEVDEEVIKLKEKLEKQRKNISEVNTQLLRLSVKELSLSDKFNKTYIETEISDYCSKIKSKNSLETLVIDKVDTMRNLLKRSVKDAYKDINDNSSYYFVKQIEFTEDQYLMSHITINKYEIENFIVTKKAALLDQSIIFKQFDPVKISVSTGIFYSSFTLRGYGVSQGETELVVTEDDIKTNTAIPATFLNFHFDFGSRTFLPLLQIGADPTKKRPFILVGAGFAIPKSKFAITGGPMWTWQQSLDKLTVGGTVLSTNDLEKDIKYSFEMVPKGWYLGLQFSF